MQKSKAQAKCYLKHAQG